MSAMKRLFQLMAEKKASDVFLSVGSPINIKINGTAMPINQQVMDSAGITNLLYEVLNDKQKKEFEETLELNTAFPLPGVGSFRISAFRQQDHAGRGGALHPRRDAQHRHPGHAAGAEGRDHGKARPGSDGGRHRLGQIDHAGRDARPQQRHQVRPHPDARGSDRIHFHQQEIASSTSAKSAPIPWTSRSR